MYRPRGAARVTQITTDTRPFLAAQSKTTINIAEHDHRTPQRLVVFLAASLLPHPASRYVKDTPSPQHLSRAIFARARALVRPTQTQERTVY